MREFEISKNEAGQRLDKYLKKLLCGASGSFIYKMLRKKNIMLNDKKADGSEKINIHDNIKLYLSEETFLKFSQEGAPGKEEQLPKTDFSNLPFQVLFENEDILVINKPSGMLSQKADAKDVSANEYILSYLLACGAVKKDELKTFHPSVCNRLDRNTSGILIAGKTLAGLQDMAEKLKSRSLKKYYQCIVSGKVEKQEHIQGYLKKDTVNNQVKIANEPQSSEDKFIETEYRPIKKYEHATLLEVYLITGRSHQIRAHLASIGHPIIGDFKYGDPKINKRYARECGITSQLLHAGRLLLENGEEISAPLPKEFEEIGRVL